MKIKSYTVTLGEIFKIKKNEELICDKSLSFLDIKDLMSGQRNRLRLHWNLLKTDWMIWKNPCCSVQFI